MDQESSWIFLSPKKIVGVAAYRMLTPHTFGLVDGGIMLRPIELKLLDPHLIKGDGPEESENYCNIEEECDSQTIEEDMMELDE